MKPSDTGPCRAEPNRSGPDSPGHCLADGLPKRLSLRLRSQSREVGQMRINRGLGNWTRHNEDRVSAEIRESDNWFFGSTEMLRVRFGVRAA
jgi:hypothetical protein